MVRWMFSAPMREQQCQGARVFAQGYTGALGLELRTVAPKPLAPPPTFSPPRILSFPLAPLSPPSSHLQPEQLCQGELGGISQMPGQERGLP